MCVKRCVASIPHPKNESFKDIELRSTKVLTPIVPKVIKRREVENIEDDELVVDNKNCGVENENKKDEGEKNEKSIDVDSIMWITKNQILEG